MKVEEIKTNMTNNEYIDIIRPYLRDTINDHKNQGEWRIHSVIQ